RLGESGSCGLHINSKIVWSHPERVQRRQREERPRTARRPAPITPSFDSYRREGTETLLKAPQRWCRSPSPNHGRWRGMMSPNKPGLLHNRRLIDELPKPDLRSICHSVDDIASACINGVRQLEISAPGEHDDYVGAVGCGRRVFTAHRGPGDSAAECHLQAASSIL